jgi:hypothetical protein
LPWFKVVRVKVAVPLEFNVPVPSVCGVDCPAGRSRKVTVPVGVAELGELAVTVAVKVRYWP